MEPEKALYTVSAGDVKFLTGSIPLVSSDEDTQRIAHLVVIVDDNSGSMCSGARLTSCGNKTVALIQACEGILYAYSTFGSAVTHWGKCPADMVTRRLTGNEGTALKLLTQAAIEAAEDLIRQHAQGLVGAAVPSFRLFFVLNTDGEAQDGTEAGRLFQAAYVSMKERFPQMQEARTFVLGIGDHHDQRVLGAMSVGEASYYNYPDLEVHMMVQDTQSLIIPEVLKLKQGSSLVFNSGRTVACTISQGFVTLDDVRVEPGETSVTLPDGVLYHISEATRRLGPDDEEYYNILIKSLEADALQLARAINSNINNPDNENFKSIMESFVASVSSLKERKIKLLADVHDFFARKPSFVETIAEENETFDTVGKKIDGLLRHGSLPKAATAAPGFATQGLGVEERRKLYTMMKRLRQLTVAPPAEEKDPSENPEEARLVAVQAVLDLCLGGIQIMRVGGKLSREIERDYMELLGSGGFKHWTDKKKGRLVDRALQQANKNADLDAEMKVSQLMSAPRDMTPVPPRAPSFLGMLYNYVIWGHPDGRMSATKNNSCWFTLMSDKQLTEEGDILCMAAYVPPKSRNLPLCSVSSALVLNTAILRGDIVVCPIPMSFMALRGLLVGGHHVARGPHGAPINAVLCLLPTLGEATDALSMKIANAYQAIATSQLLTTRWIYTEGTGEYKNGVLSVMMALVASRKGSGTDVSSSDKDALVTSLLGFYTTFKGTTFVKSIYSRTQCLLKGLSTSGEVPTVLVAVADRMIDLIHTLEYVDISSGEKVVESISTCRENYQDTKLTFWRVLLLRVLRDAFGSTFTAFADANDINGAQLRHQKEIDAESFMEILAQGLNFPEGVDDGDMLSFINELGYAVSGRIDSVDISAITLEDVGEIATSVADVTVSKVGTVDTKEEVEDCGFDTFFDVYEMDEDLIGGVQSTASATVAVPSATPEDIAPHEQPSAPTRAVRLLNTVWIDPNAEAKDQGVLCRVPGSPVLKLRDLISIALRWRERLGVRSGAPSAIRNPNSVVAGASGRDICRVAIINCMLDCLDREIEILVRSDIHLRHQVDFYSRLLGFPLPAMDKTQAPNDICSAFRGLVGLRNSDIDFIWLLSQVLVSIELRSNTRYRTDLSIMAPSIDTNEESGLLRLDPSTIVLKFDGRYSRKQVAKWECDEVLRKKRCKTILTMHFLQHPKHSDLLPLVIFNATHRAAISRWTSRNRGFDVMGTVSPISDEPTGMASNTYLKKRSKYFMKKVNPFMVVTAMYGSGEERLHSRYRDHFHTYSHSAFLTTWSASENIGQSWSEFLRLLSEYCSESMLTHKDFMTIWVQWAFQESLSAVSNEDIPALEEFVKRRATIGTTEEDLDFMLKVLRENALWYSDPCAYLDRYFASDECHPRNLVEKSEFLQYCRDNDVVPKEVEYEKGTIQTAIQGELVEASSAEIDSIIDEIYRESLAD